jgi:3-oxoacyl-[acyl-carrier protein] reductase
MTQSLARVMGPQIRVNAVCPGFIQGEWLQQGLGEEKYQSYLNALEHSAPLQRTCTADSVAQSIVGFIDGHSIVTGQHIILDGGQHLM